MDHSAPCHRGQDLFLTLDQVRRELKKTKARKATGPDQISPRLLRVCANQLSKVVKYIFNLNPSLERVLGSGS